MNPLVSLIALSLAAPQVTADLKLKLREDETVKYRNVFNVVTYSPDKIDERVQNSLMSFTFGAEKDGKIPVKATIEDYEGMDQGSNGAAPAMRMVALSFSVSKKGVADDATHSTGNPAVEPVGVLLRKTLDGMNSVGFLGLTMPEKPVAVGEKWSQKVDAADFLAPALAPAGEAFKVDGIYDVLFTLVDVTNVNNKRHARISVDVTGKSNLEINSPEFSAGGSLTLTSATSILLDLETGLISSARTDTSADITIGEASAQIVMWNLLYRKG
jgi:hypothetical protein